jgi:hypothetical protein
MNSLKSYYPSIESQIQNSVKAKGMTKCRNFK